MNTHIPGPWKAYEATEDCALPFGVYIAVGTEAGKGARTSIVCRMIGQGDGKYEPEVTNRNAMLIAAAPDLLAACINVLDTTRILHGYYTDTGVNDTELVKELRAAIAKAGVSL